MKIIMRKKLFLSSAGALLVAIILTTAVAMDAQWLNSLDNLFIQHRIPDISYLTVFAGATATFATIGPMLVIFSVLAIFLLRINYKGLAVWSLGNLFLISGVGYLLKQLLQRTRPGQVQYIARSSYSFPSGHSLLIMTFICSLFLIYFFREKKLPIFLKLVLILLGITIAGGRLYLGVHYFSDILTGLFLGAGLTFGTACLFYPYLQQSTPRLTRTRKSAFSTWQKVLLSAIAVLVVLVSGASVFALKFYHSSQKMADSMYSPIERTGKLKSPEATEPMSILILGIANDAKRKTDFRANTIMVATLNNQTKETTLVSIPRDSFVEIVGADYQDKINHAHSIGGPEMIMNTVEKFLDIPIHHYVSVNMDGLQTLVDAVGGVTVDNDFAFSAEGIDYPKGKQHLNGWEALQYSRMRYEDPTGDYGRQGRQREVMELLINKILSTKSIFSYQKILDGIGENGKTDLTFDQMQKILTGYHSCLTKIDSQQVQGEGFTGDGVTGEKGISYQKIPQEEVDRVKELLHKQLDIEDK
ncbi:phosphatase PAP2/LCP family protein [Enterococcus gilvus]|uniref:phosphatase PAP2/LCP family protein n=1 Tax=Enterococcus gilvus TaxID=160453 RepID=UPI0021AB8E87|nr:phosphatase PAP2/LCP family protein [Enterococcus gilvus]